MVKKEVVPDSEALVILDCCDIRFSKVLPINGRPPVVDGDLFIACKGEGFITKVVQIFPKKSEVNPYCLDAIFVESSSRELFEKLCDSLDAESEWHEGEGACRTIQSIR
jgi:hypothetical protein